MINIFRNITNIFKSTKQLQYLKENELEFSEFIVAPASTQTTINMLKFQHYLKHKDDNIKHQDI